MFKKVCSTIFLISNLFLFSNLLAQSSFIYDTLIIYPDNSNGKQYNEYSSIILKGKIVTMDKDEKGEIKIIDDGRLIIKGEKIVAILSKNEKLPSTIDSASSIYIDTNGLIFPGLINAHDHIHYNAIPLWKVPKKYTDRYQWTNHKTYDTDIGYPRHILSMKKYFGIEAENMKYCEVKQIVGGTTSAQGSPNGSKKFARYLVRNLDVTEYFGEDKMSSYVRPIKDVKQGDIDKWIDKMNSGDLRAFFLHIGEGTDEKVHSEFDFLIKKKLDRKETIIIHGTAMDDTQLKHMADKDMTLVWSPTSNVLLYGETANIPVAKKYGVNLCLGTDWSPSGGKNLFGELKIAYEYNKAKFKNIVTYKDLVEMVTCNPADAIGWSNYVGRLKTGMYADLFIINDTGKDPFETLVNATEKDVNLVIIGGNPYYGDYQYMKALKPGDFEYIVSPCGFTKCLDVTDDNVELGDQTFKYLYDLLRTALSFDPAFMEKHFTDEKIGKYDSFEEYLNDVFPEYHPVNLDPLYISMDEYFFWSLVKNINANLPFDIKFIYYNQ